MIIQSLPMCILTEKSSILTILEDYEILLEAFISVIFHWSMQLRDKRKWRTYLEVWVIINQKKRSKVEILENAQSIFDGRRQIVMAFEQNIFPLPQQPKDEKYAFDILLWVITKGEENINNILFLQNLVLC